MKNQATLRETISQYPLEFLDIIGSPNISEEEGLQIMGEISGGLEMVGSDGSVKDGVGGHVFSITDSSFTTKIAYKFSFGIILHNII